MRVSADAAPAAGRDDPGMAARSCLAVCALAAAVATGAAARGAPRPHAVAATITVGWSANGSTIRPHRGDTLVVRLAGNPSTGYAWTVARLPAVLRLVSLTYVQSLPARPGRGGTYVGRFAVRAAGRGSLRMVYRRAWERTKPPLRVFTLVVSAR